MSNEIEKHGKAALVPGSAQPTVNVNQPIETLITHANTVSADTHNIYNFNSYGSIPGMPTAAPPAQTVFNHDYYNLLVYGGEIYFTNDDSRNHVTLSKERCLSKTSTDPDTRSELCSLSEEAIKKIKTFPALIAYENKMYGKTTDDHYACFGAFTDIKNRSNGIEIYFHPICAFPQQPLNTLLFELGLSGNSRFNELNNSHWAIKQIDLIEVLKENELLKEW